MPKLYEHYMCVVYLCNNIGANFHFHLDFLIRNFPLL